MDEKQIARINGVEIPAVLNNGEWYIPIKPICQALGIEFETQRDKINTDEILSSVAGLRPATGSDGKKYEMLCLPLKYVYGWLATINPKNVAPEASSLFLIMKASRSRSSSILR